MVSGTDNLEFQTKLYYLIRYYPEPIIKPFNFSVLISKRGIVIKYIKKRENKVKSNNNKFSTMLR